MESDFVEAMRSPRVLAKFARHYQTGEAIPPEQVARMNRASAFGRGNWVSQQNTYTAISYDIYKGKPQNVDLVAVTTETRSGTAIRSRRREPIFTHPSAIWRSIRRHTTRTCGIR